MKRPAPYPQTDASESDSITVLRSCLDSKRVKFEFRERDKLPNTDGTIELIEENGYPVGKLDVQVRKIAAGATSCRCGEELVAYSKVTTLPLLLIGVDPSLSRCFWSHVSEVMPSYRRDQKSFTVRFDPVMSKIDSSATSPCYRQWLDLVVDYQNRISQYPLLQVGPNTTPAKLSPMLLEAIQGYLDEINTLLDHEFAFVKKILFPKVWKFGVACRAIDAQQLLYQTTMIPRGELAPMIAELPADVTLMTFGDNIHTSSLTSIHDFLATPAGSARTFVFSLLRDVLNNKLLSVGSAELAKEAVFAFIDRYHRILQVDPASEQFKLDDIRIAMGPGLSAIASIARVSAVRGEIGMLDLARPVPERNRCC